MEKVEKDDKNILLNVWILNERMEAYLCLLGLTFATVEVNKNHLNSLVRSEL